MNYIPHHIFMSAEIRSLNSLEDKAAHIKNLCENLSLAEIFYELHAYYTQSLRRCHHQLNGKEWTGVGRTPLVGYKDVGNMNDFIKRQYLISDSAHYIEIIEDGY